MNPVFTLCMLLWLFREELNVLNKVQGNRSFLLKQEYFLASAKEQLNSLTGKYFEKYRISSAFGRLQNSSVVFIRPHERGTMASPRNESEQNIQPFKPFLWV